MIDLEDDIVALAKALKWGNLRAANEAIDRIAYVVDTDCDNTVLEGVEWRERLAQGRASMQ